MRILLIGPPRPKKKISKQKADVEAVKVQQALEAVKLASALAEIDNLKKEVRIFQSEVASLTKWVETFDTHQKINVETMEISSKNNASLK